MNRRTFLQLSGVAGAMMSNDGFGASPQRPFPMIPTLDSLAATPIRRKYIDLFNLPIAMNDWGSAQVVKSVTALSAISFPPYSCCGIPEVTWSPGFINTCEIFVDNQLPSTLGPPENEVIYRWYPHRVEREQTALGLKIQSTVFLPPKTRAVVMVVKVTNLGSSLHAARLGFDMRAAVTKKTTAWFAQMPGEGDNRLTWDASRSRLTFESSHAPASSAQGMQPSASRLASGNVLEYDIEFEPGQTKTLTYVNAVADSPMGANALVDQLQSKISELLSENEATFRRLIQSAFTPGNSDFSGHLPKLETDDEALWNLYHNGFRNLLTARRVSPDSVYGATYLTLSGHVLPTLSFPWDTSLTSLSLAFLDPEPLRNLVEVWFTQDLHKHLATDYVTGQGVGPWYGVNDMATVRCARDYLRVTGNFGWLDKRVGEKTVIDHLYGHATHWKTLKGGIEGLGDYGTIENILEVVSTYLHQIAGMNAGNVDSMRFLAELYDRRGEQSRATQLRQDALALADRINRLLYVEGKGWWRCGQPNGSYNEARHCYDFLAVLDNMSDLLSPTQKREMAAYFWDQLATRKWMRALSSGDPDASWNPRTDHSCLGAYAAWPPMSAKGLYKIETPARIVPWLREVSRTGNQGPIGQAHFAEQVFPTVDGAAAKAANDAPYQEDWSCIAGGAFTDLVIDSIFGVTPTLYDGLKATPRLTGFDGNARLVGLRYQGELFNIDRHGCRKL